jgi:hypothetical protein
MDYKTINSQLSSNHKNPISLSDELFEDYSLVSEIDRGKVDTIKLNSISFPVIDPTEMVFNKIIVSSQQSQREPYHRGYNNQELDSIPVNIIQVNLENYRRKWSAILGLFSFFIPGSGQFLCNRVKTALLFILISILCIAASYLLTYRVLAGFIIIGIASGIDEYRAVKKFNFLPYFRKYWFFPVLLLIIYAGGIYFVLKRTWQ